MSPEASHFAIIRIMFSQAAAQRSRTPRVQLARSLNCPYSPDSGGSAQVSATQRYAKAHPARFGLSGATWCEHFQRFPAGLDAALRKLIPIT